MIHDPKYFKESLLFYSSLELIDTDYLLYQARYKKKWFIILKFKGTTSLSPVSIDEILNNVPAHIQTELLFNLDLVT